MRNTSILIGLCLLSSAFCNFGYFVTPVLNELKVDSNYDVDSLCNILSESEANIRITPIEDDIKKLNKMAVEKQDYIKNIGKAMENSEATQGYFDGSMDTVDQLYACLKNKNSSVELSKNFIEFSKFFDQVAGLVDGGIKESVVYYMDTQAIKIAQNERILAGADPEPVLEQVNVNSDALFGLFIVLFFFTVVLIWFCCAQDVDGPAIFNTENLKYGKEC